MLSENDVAPNIKEELMHILAIVCILFDLEVKVSLLLIISVGWFQSGGHGNDN